MKTARRLMLGSILAAGALFPFAGTASAATTYGPYSSQGFCNYLMYGVRAGGHQTSNCWYHPNDAVCPPEYGCNNGGWYFTQYT